MDKVEKVSENVDGAVIEEIGSPEGDHVEDVDIMEPDVDLIYDGEVVGYDEEEDEEDEESTAPDEQGVEEEEEPTEEASDGESSEASPPEESEDTSQEAPDDSEEGASPEQEPEREAFTLNVDGQSYDVPDAYVEDDNIVIPRDSFQRVIQPRVADRSVWQKERQQYEQKIQELDPEKNPTVVKARTLLDNMLSVLEDDEKAEEFFSHFASNRDKLILEAERKALEAEKEQMNSSKQRENQAKEAEELPKQMDAAIDNILNEARDIDQYSSVDMDYVRDLIEPIKGSFFFRAEEDMPQAGLKKGEIGVRIDLIEQVIEKEARRSSSAREIEETRKRNKAALGNDSESDDPAPPALEPDNPVEVTEPPKIESREDWDAHLAAVAAGR